MHSQCSPTTVVHLTGMSGTGKSTTLETLARRGWDTIDTDFGNWLIASNEGELVWDESKIDALLAAVEPHSRLVIAGTVRNQAAFRDRFTAVVLLSAPLETMLRRVVARETNPYGKTPSQRDQIREDTATVFPLLYASADLELDTSLLDSEAVADAIEQFMRSLRPTPS